MKKFLSLAIVLCFGLLSNFAVAVPYVMPQPPNLSAKTYVLMDFESGKVLADKDADLPIEPASMTKIMTAYVVFNELKRGNIKLDDTALISEKAWKMPGSKMFLRAATRVKVEDLIQGMIVQSGNDASVALAEFIAGSEQGFVDMMNQYSQELGLTNSHYVNVTGLPHPDHYASANDLAKLTALLIHNFPEYYHWYAQKSFKYAGITQYNRNKLLWQDDTVDGVKTGHTEAAGYCLVTSAKREGQRLISVVTGTDSMRERIGQSQRLLNYGFRFFETRKLYEANTKLASLRVWEGAQDQVDAVIAEPLWLSAPRGQFASIKADIQFQPEVLAPIEKGQVLGQLVVSLNDEVLATAPVVAMHGVEEGSFMKKAWDQLALFFNHLMQWLGLK